MEIGLERLRDYLSSKYDIEILDITPIKNVLRISTSQGDKCLKRVKYGEADFLFILSAMQHLVQNGFQSILPFIPTKAGELFVELKNGFGFLTEWITSRECNYSNPIDVKMAAVTLSRLHRASEGFSPSEYPYSRIGWGKWIEKFSKRLKELELFKKIIDEKKNLTYFDRFYRENIDYFLHQGTISIKHLEQANYLNLSNKERVKKTFCHHDYANHNILITEDLKVYIIDFDYLICDMAIHDLSSMIIRNMRHGNYSMEKAQYILDCYSIEGRIAKEEIPVINGFIEFPQDFWQVGLQYYIEKQRWEDYQFNKRLDNVIKDMADREEFIKEFTSEIEI